MKKKICSGYSRVGPVFRYPWAWQGHLGSGFAWSQVPRLASNSEPCAPWSRPHTLSEIFRLTALAETSWFRNPGWLWLEEKSKKATQPRKYGRNHFDLSSNEVENVIPEPIKGKSEYAPVWPMRGQIFDSKQGQNLSPAILEFWSLEFIFIYILKKIICIKLKFLLLIVKIVISVKRA